MGGFQERGQGEYDLPNISDLIGIPFLNLGRDPKIGLDCYGLFMEVNKRFGQIVTNKNIACEDIVTASIEVPEDIANYWSKVEIPEPGDAVAMSLNPIFPGVVQHFGVYLGDSRYIHTLKKVGVIISKINDPAWEKRIRGFYRWKKCSL